MVLFPSVPIGTLTVPSSATSISSSLKSKSLFAALTASLTFCFSSSVSFEGLATVVIAGSFKVLPALSKGLTVSFASNLPVFVPSVTVTLPLSSTVTTASLLNLVLLASLTAAATLSLSAFVKLVGSFTSVLSGASSLRIVSFWTTVLSAGMVPTFPPWLISTVPSGFTVISSSLKFLSGFASFTAFLIAAISSGFNSPILSTFTGSFGGLKLFLTSFCLTVCSGVNVPVLPSFVTVTVPSSSTTTSAGVKFNVEFALITAASTFSCSSDDNAFVSLTSTGVGAFKSKGVLSVFSQTA